MSFPTEYKILGQKKIQIKNISIVPIRLEDRFEIMKWCFFFYNLNIYFEVLQL